jgi:hypothetical protein
LSAEYDRVALAGTDDLPDNLLTQLYGENPADFVARRTAAVKELREQGQPEVARRVASLRRPTASVWAANRLHEVAPRELEDLIESGRRLREAQIAALEGKAVSDFRSLLKAHSTSLQRAVDAAAGFLAGQGQNVSDVVRQRLQTTLRAASLAAPELQAALAAGRLVADQEPEGFGAFEGIEPGPPAPAEPEATTKAPGRAAPDLAAQARAARTAADAQAQVASKALEEARALRARATQLADEAAAAEARAGAAAEKAGALEGEATEAEQRAAEET